MTRKHYATNEHVELLEQVVGAAFGTVSAAKGRALLKRLEEVEIAGILVNDLEFRSVSSFSADEVGTAFHQLKDVIEDIVTPRGVIPSLKAWRAKEENSWDGWWLASDAVVMAPSTHSELIQVSFHSIKTSLKFQLYRLACSVGRDSLHRCDCGAIFVQHGKRRSCSVRCQKRVYMRSYRPKD
jgi:hypothetical protein